MGYVLGVDLGTTFTAAAVRRGDRVGMVTLGTDGDSIPSVVFLDKDGSTLIGDAARRRSLTESDRVAREFKRRLGDPIPLLIAGAPLSADILMGKLLAAVIALVTQREGGAPDAVAVAHPANWGPFKTDLLRNAATMAGIADVILVPEPVAAATEYAAADRLDDGTVVAVYDLGGGTFDAAVLRKDADGFTVLGTPEGIERLGGVDFDAAVIRYVDRALGGAMSEIDPEDASAAGAAARLHRECVEAKEGLSEDMASEIGVYLPNRTDQVRLTRSEFEELIRPALNETVAALRRAIASSEIPADQIDRVLLVGGSSRIPLVAEMVGSELGRPVSVDAHPKHTVAMGAARLADVDQVTGEPPAPASTASTSRIPPPPPPPPPPSPTIENAAAAVVGRGPADDIQPVDADSVGAGPVDAEPVDGAADDPREVAVSAGPGGGTRRRRSALIAAAAVVALAIIAGVAVVLSSGGGDGDDVEGVQPIVFTTERADDGSCTATWEFPDDSFATDEELWVSWEGTVVAEGPALEADDVKNDIGFDKLSLVRDGTVVQEWTPQTPGC